MQPRSGDGEATPPSQTSLSPLCDDVPQFRIWREDACGQVRYIARGQDPGQHPHTVVTADPGELRAALGDNPRATQTTPGGTECCASPA